jgi:hypothetical protein
VPVTAAAISPRFLLGTEVLATLGPAFRRSRLDDLPVDAAPSSVPSTSDLGSLPGRITRNVFRLGLGFRNLNNLSINANPAHLLRAISPRFFLRRETSQISVLGLLLVHLHDLAVLADPAEPILAIPLRFFLRRVTGNVVFLRL